MKPGCMRVSLEKGRPVGWAVVIVRRDMGTGAWVWRQRTADN